MSNIPFDVIVFDFDGTLVQSAAAKRKTFFDIFPADFAPAVAAVLNRDPDGSRNRVIPEMIAEAERTGHSNRSISSESLIGAYGTAVATAVEAAPETPGASGLLKSLSGQIPIYVVSVTPHEQLTKLLELRGWLNLFNGVFGYPFDKTQTVADLLVRHGIQPSRLLMVGDGESDALAAARNGCQHHMIRIPEDLSALSKLGKHYYV